MRDYKEYTIFDGVTPQALTSSTDADPVVVTKASHGLASGDIVLIYGHTTNTTVNGIWEVEIVNSSTFRLKDINTGDYVAGAGGGAGADGILMTAPKIILCSDYRHAIIHYQMSSSGNATTKVAGSLGKNSADASAQHGDTPNFGATVSATNPYTFLATVNLEDSSVIEGDTGLVASGSGLTRTIEVNTDGQKYLTLVPTAWTAGSIDAKVKLFTS